MELVVFTLCAISYMFFTWFNYDGYRASGSYLQLGLSVISAIMAVACIIALINLGVHYYG